MSFVSNISPLKEYFSNLPEVKRIKELEKYIDTNEEIKKSFNEIKRIQKNLVSSKEFHQDNQYQLYLEEYKNAKMHLLDLPFVEEYLELIEIVGTKLKDASSLIEEELQKTING